MTTTPSSLGLALAVLGGAVSLIAESALAVTAQEAERRVILVNVVERNGNQVPGLSAANFQGESRGKPLTIVSATPDKAPRRIAVVVDTSASQNGVPVWKAAEELVGSLAPANSVVILTMAATLQKHSDLTNDRAALLEAIRAARARKADGGTAVYDGALQASEGFAKAVVGDVVCLFTDGEDTVSRLDSNEVIAAVARRGVRVFVVRTKRANSMDLNRSGYQYASEWMAAITKATGGRLWTLDELAKDGGAQTLRAMITDGYRLEVQLPGAADKAGEWKLKVIGADGKKLPDVRVVYPALMPHPVGSAN